jgi:hypothetical protein
MNFLKKFLRNFLWWAESVCICHFAAGMTSSSQNSFLLLRFKILIFCFNRNIVLLKHKEWVPFFPKSVC